DRRLADEVPDPADGPLPGRLARVRHRAARRWQREREGAAPPRLALDPDPPAVELDERAAEREAQTGALLGGAVGPSGLGELVEYAHLIRGRDAHAGVADRDQHAGALGLGLERDGAARGGEFHRVGQQVEDDLL